MKESAIDLLAGFDAALPLEEATAPPADWYTDAEFFDAELRTVFRRNWLAAARLDQLQEIGSYVAGRMGKLPYVLTRDEHGDLHALANVCRHRAAEVAAGAGRGEHLQCAYHGWTYGLNGRLRSAPELGGVARFDRSDYGLLPLAVSVWGPFAFLAAETPEYPLETELAELAGRLEATDYLRLQFVERRTYDLACNWKVFVDNYLDGGYHVATLHPGLASQLTLGSYRCELFERYAIQSCDSGNGEDSPSSATEACSDFAERVAGGAIYAWIYPNLMINRYGPIMDTNVVLPLDAGRCRVIFDWYFADTEGEAGAAFVEKSIAASDQVQQEDIAICESVQRGLASGSYRPGPYSVKRQMAEHRFHQMLAADVGRSE